jgi:D-alanine-D-alanine ligase
MKKKMHILIAYNDTSSVATPDQLDLVSEVAVREEAENVHQAILNLGYVPSYFPIRDILVDLKILKNKPPDVIFNLCEGYQGSAVHEMHLTGIWELMGIPYTGNAPLTLGLAQNKVLTKKLLESKKIPTPKFQVFEGPPDRVYLNYPLIVKPVNEDASLGISQGSVVQSPKELFLKVEEILHKYRKPVLVEEYIHGREFNISILGNSPLKILPVSEISFTDLVEGEYHITSYEAKWLPDHPMYRKTPAICPAKISSDLKNRLEDIAVQVFKLLRGRDYGRVDVRVDSENKIYVLEFNPNPDISKNAGYANAIKAAGLKYENFINHLIHQASSRGADD